MFMSTIDNHPVSAFTRKSNAAVTLPDGGEGMDLSAAYSPP